MNTVELYRLFNADDELLYVGVGTSARERSFQHKASKAWWPEVSRTEIETFESRDDALRAEQTAIGTERPRYNVAFAPSPKPRSLATWRGKSRVSPDTKTRLLSDQQRYADAITNRDATIRQARAEGASLREIAQIVGLSHTEVRRVIQRGKPT